MNSREILDSSTNTEQPASLPGQVQPVVIREVGIPPETIERQYKLLADCAKTFGLDDPSTKAYAASVARHLAICSRLEITVDNVKGETQNGTYSRQHINSGTPQITSATTRELHTRPRP